MLSAIPAAGIFEWSASDKLGSFRLGTWKPHVSMIADVSKFRGAEETKGELRAALCLELVAYA
jgi:hypothetical protein